MSHTQQSAFLLLQDGTFLQGKAFGKTGTATGEICFNTGMTGYQGGFYRPKLLWPGSDNEQCTYWQLWHK